MTTIPNRRCFGNVKIKHSLNNQVTTFQRSKPSSDLSIGEQITLYFILVLAFSHVLLTFVGE